MLRTVCDGFCMALADSVPGVSGGTIAFILGFYDDFMNSLHYVIKGNSHQRWAALSYLLQLGVGWVFGLLLSMLFLYNILQSRIYFLTSLFLGLTIASLPFICVSEKAVLFANYKNLFFTVLGIGLVYLLSIINFHNADSAIINFADLGLFQAVYLFVSGIFAITAMVLPGISGSTLLLVFGVYTPMVSALGKLALLDLSVIPGLFMLCLGIVFGIVVTVKFVRAALKKYRSAMIYWIIGLLLGSLYAIVQGPAMADNTASMLTLQTFSMTGFLLGILILFGLEFLRL
jgi:putative membrane protein